MGRKGPLTGDGANLTNGDGVTEVQRANRIILLLDKQCVALKSQVTIGEKAIRVLSKRLEEKEKRPKENK